MMKKMMFKSTKLTALVFLAAVVSVYGAAEEGQVVVSDSETAASQLHGRKPVPGGTIAAGPPIRELKAGCTYEITDNLWRMQGMVFTVLGNYDAMATRPDVVLVEERHAIKPDLPGSESVYYEVKAQTCGLGKGKHKISAETNCKFSPKEVNHLKNGNCKLVEDEDAPDTGYVYPMLMEDNLTNQAPETKALVPLKLEKKCSYRITDTSEGMEGMVFYVKDRTATSAEVTVKAIMVPDESGRKKMEDFDEFDETWVAADIAKMEAGNCVHVPVSEKRRLTALEVIFKDSFPTRTA